MKRFVIFLVVLGLFSCNSSNKKKEKEQIVVYCAASLTDVLTELGKEFEKANKINVKLNLASSGTLARQIKQGAPADIFLSANKEWMDYLDSIGLAENNTVSAFAGNSLVVVSPLSSGPDTVIFNDGSTFPDCFEGRLSIGDPEYVPAGTYARKAFQKLGCYGELQNRLLPAKDVRSALLVVELSEVEAGVVYKTDALKSGKVRIVGYIPDNLHEPISYYIALVKGHKNDSTIKFYAFILSGQAKPIWVKYGFDL